MGGAKTSPVDDMSYLRKIRKPMVERRRRDRMNHSIDQLKVLISDTIRENVEPLTRVEKADVLELTVAHLRRQQQHVVSMTTESSGYLNGYSDCAQGVINFLASNGLVSGNVMDRVSQHLHNTYLNRSRDGTRCANLTQDQSTSTPLRPRCCEKLSPLGQLTGFSPIPQVGTSIPVPMQFGLSFSDQSVSCSSMGSSSDIWSRSSVNSSSDIYSSESDHSTDLVSIGRGSDSAVGHVIKDKTWRPW